MIKSALFMTIRQCLLLELSLRQGMNTLLDKGLRGAVVELQRSAWPSE